MEIKVEREEQKLMKENKDDKRLSYAVMNRSLR